VVETLGLLPHPYRALDPIVPGPCVAPICADDAGRRRRAVPGDVRCPFHRVTRDASRRYAHACRLVFQGAAAAAELAAEHAAIDDAERSAYAAGARMDWIHATRFVPIRAHEAIEPHTAREGTRG